MTSLECLRIDNYRRISQALLCEKPSARWYCSKDFFLLEFHGKWDMADANMQEMHLTERKTEVLKEIRFLLALTWDGIRSPSSLSEDYSKGLTLCHPIHSRNSVYSLSSRFREIQEYSWLPLSNLVAVKIYDLDNGNEWGYKMPEQMVPIHDALEEMATLVDTVDHASKLNELKEKHLTIFWGLVLDSLKAHVEYPHGWASSRSGKTGPFGRKTITGIW